MISIDYFSDILCVWAYGGQIRLDELTRNFGGDVRIRHRFIPLFADTRARIGEGWKEQGGFAGFGSHMQEVCGQWPHTRLNARAWTECRPLTCVTAHVFLKAVELCLVADAPADRSGDEVRQRYSLLIDRTRAAFFEQAQDISQLPVLLALLGDDPIGRDAVIARIDSGEAYAALYHDEQLAKGYAVQGSPTYVFNEGRQLLYGNVGYRIIESNVRELLSARQVEGAPSWC